MKRLLVLWVLVGQPLSGEVPAVDRWEPDVARIEARVRHEAPAPGGTFFVGSSTIRLWKLNTSFPGVRATNVGFGGSQIADCTRFAPRLVVPWKPARIVFYAGSNDVNAGKPPARVVADFKEFAALVHGALPSCQITFLAINPSASRWKQWDRAREANRLIGEWCAASDPSRLRFIDLSGLFLGDDGLPRAEFYLDDKLHLNDAGYAAWVRKLGPLLGLK